MQELFKISSRYLSSLTKGVTKKQSSVRHESHPKRIYKFFDENPSILKLKSHIPVKYLKSHKNNVFGSMYLICPDIAKRIADIILPYLTSSRNQIIAESNAGLGLISNELLDSGIKSIRLYEHCPEFISELKDFKTVYKERVELFRKDLFHLSIHAYMDKMDKSNRVELLLKNVPNKKWTDDPVLTVIGPMPELTFLKFLLKSLALQMPPLSYGRIQIFALMRAKDYAVMCATPKDRLTHYQSWSVLFNIILEHKLLDVFPRKMFLPWDPVKKNTRVTENLDRDKMYLVRINFKRELPIPFEDVLPLYFFVKQFYGKGNKKIIATVERYVPECGKNIIMPVLEHENYYTDINIYTKFRELTPNQILAIFKEMRNFPTYSTSPFISMIETELMKMESVDPDIADVTSENDAIDEIEENI